MRKWAILAAGAALLLAAVPVFGAKPISCTTIQDGTLRDVKGNLITIGYDAWGYSYQAHMFNGWYWNSARPDVPWTKETLEAAGKSTTWLVMKWSDEWLSNKDCNDDGKLDRGYSCDPDKAGSSACQGAWETNHQFGSYVDEETGETCNWNYFVKIVMVPADAYKEPEDANGSTIPGMWYTADGKEIGSVIWTAYARILQIYNDPCAGETGVENKFETPAGFGFYK